MNIAVLGNGEWGIALAELSKRRGHVVKIWGRSARSNECSNLEDAIVDAEIVFFAIPSHAMRDVCLKAKEYLSQGVLLVSVAKGVEEGSGSRMSEIIHAVSGRKEVLSLSGPTFAKEVLDGLPSAIVCAAANENWARQIQTALNGDDFRVYTNTDIVGVEWGGALKNVIAIAAGACVGSGLGYNSLAALITRGMAELARVGTILGGQSQTFFGLSGVGDLILTCSSSLSRNRRVGEALGKGQKLPEILKQLNGTAEGIKTSHSVYEILNERKVEAPILREVYSIVHEQKSVSEAVRTLMGRQPKPEFKKS
jgi:glycerol-3-phosphate dehydrogenase (NAD(P)+)